jgi:hypothetical protein
MSTEVSIRAMEFALLYHASRGALASDCGFWFLQAQTPQAETCVAKAYESYFGKGNGCGGEDAAAASFLDEYHGAQVGAIPFAGRVHGEG